jgi:hypothetical protein
LTLKTLSGLDETTTPHNFEARLGRALEERVEAPTGVLIPVKRLAGLEAVSVSGSYYLIDLRKRK